MLARSWCVEVTLCLSILIFSASQSFAQSGSHDEQIMQIKGKWTNGGNRAGSGDPAFPRSQYKYAFAVTDQITDMIKTIYPRPAGVEAFHHAIAGQWAICSGCPAAYSFWSFYKSYYFNTHLNKIMLAGETRTTVRVHVNQFGLYFLNGEGTELVIDGQPTRVYTPLNKEGEWKGFPLYTSWNWLPGNREKSTTRIILITQPGKQPVIPLTQKQYLTAVRLFWEGEKKKVADKNESGNQEALKMIEEAKNNNYMDAETKAKLIATLQRAYDESVRKNSSGQSNLTEQYDKKIQIINQYLSSHAEHELQQPVVTAASSFMDFPGHFGTSGNETPVTPVRVNPSYFRSDLPKHAPQFMVMEWNAEDDAPGGNFRKIFEEGFAVETLAAMIGKDVTPQEKPTVVIKFNPETDPELKAIRLQAERYADSMMRFSVKASEFSLVKPAGKDTLDFTLPDMNNRWISAVPQKKLKPTELKRYLDAVEKKYTTLLHNQGVKLPGISAMNVGEMSYGSAVLLVNGMNEQAAWVAIRAAQNAPDNVLVLNNTGAVLNACGFQPVAVPVLETALEASPGNTALQNNLGQAHLGLGNIAKATEYLQQSVSGNPDHPHANLSLALIHYKQGDIGNAIKHAEHSLRGSFSDGAWNLLLKLKPDARLLKYLKDRYKPPEYFNEEKYHLPRQCEKVSEIGSLKGEYSAYREMLGKVQRQFESIRDEEYAEGARTMMEKVKNYEHSGIRRSPFTGLGNAMLYDRKMRLEDERDVMIKAQHVYNKSIAELYKTYRSIRPATEDCGERIEIANVYMQRMAYVTSEYQKEWMKIWRNFYDEYAFWLMVANPDNHLQKAGYAGVVSTFVGELLRVAETHFLEPSIDCGDTFEITTQEKDFEEPVIHCPIDISLEFGIGSFKLDCEKIEYHFGGLLVADVVHSFRDHRTTIAIGAGLDLKFGSEALKAGPVQGGFKATGKMQYFLTFDGTRPADQGIIWETAIKYKQTLKSGVEGIKRLETMETNSVNISANTVLSVHNGWSFGGSLYEHLDKIIDAR